MRLKQSDLSKRSKYGSILEKKDMGFPEKVFCFLGMDNDSKFAAKKRLKVLEFQKRSKTGFFQKNLFGCIGRKSYSFLKPSKVADLLYIATETVKFLELFKNCDFLQKKKRILRKKIIKGIKFALQCNWKKKTS